MKFATALLAMGAVAADDHIDVFHISNYKNLVSSLISNVRDNKLTTVQGTGDVTWK